LSNDANGLIRDFEFLWSKQGNFRVLWNQSAQFTMPAWDNFIGEFAEGVNRNTRIFDSTGSIANARFSAAMEAMLTPRSQIWHKLKAADENLNDNPEVQKYLDRVNKILFAARYHPEANFASQTDECYLSLGAFGNNLLFIDEMAGRCLRYRSVPLSELCWALNHQGQIDTVYRKFKYTAKQAIDMWGDKVPEAVKNLYHRTPYEEAEFLHVIKPNSDFTPMAYGDRGKKYESWYIHLGSKSVIERGSYRTFPCAVGRYRVAPRENYGRGPAIDCFPDIRTANEMVKTALRQGQLAINPPMLLAEESVLSNFNQRPGANNYGMLTSDGKVLAQPLKSEANFEVGEKMLEDTRSVIRDTFLNTLFQILVQNPNMTATEALLRAQEKGELIAPAMGRQQSEFLGPLIHREIDCLSAAGQIPPPPMALLRSGKGLQIEYTSPLARALRAEEGTAIMNTVQDLGVMAQIDPSVRQIMDLHEAFREMANIRGCPAKIMRSEEEVDALMQHAADQQQQQQTAAAIPALSKSALNLAQAGQAAAAGGSGGGAPSIPQGQ
jgi:hypothetical protein